MEAGGEVRDARDAKREAGAADGRRAIRSYEGLEVYQRAMKLLVPLHALLLKFPDYERFELASQLRRASKSIPANIAEGYGKKGSTREFRAYLNNALGSANEVIVHLRIAETLGYAKGDQLQDLVGGYTIVAKQLHTLMATWKTFESATKAGIPLPASRVALPVSKE